MCRMHFHRNIRTRIVLLIFMPGDQQSVSAVRELMLYTERMAHALSGGVHVADVAVYYNAEAEWSGGKYMLQQEVCCALTRNQIDFDLIPQDVLAASECREGKLAVNEESYGALIVPYSQYLPKRVTDAISRLLRKGCLSFLWISFRTGHLSFCRWGKRWKGRKSCL